MIDQALALLSSWPLWAQVAAGIAAFHVGLFVLSLAVCMIGAVFE